MIIIAARTSNLIYLLKKFPIYYGTKRFITVFTRAHPLVLTLSQISPVYILSPLFL
jgi:hypothetical protein